MFRRLALAAVLLAAAAAPAAAQCDTRFTLRNNSGSQVNEFYFGPSSNSNWGRDRLGENVLPNGRQVSFTPGGRGGAYDFKVVWASGETAELMRVNICEASEIIATPRGIQAR
ncbi:hypothetical protein [Falsiroseomonas tokyonensis]|uniref:Uncharacterized protein n=1 Tax=Falsiroseomonas tokyonensis TaxID=430521 RepID=A0ABV7BPB2_9PROT|nr:hypothetical protein [Falsiroseomonas tokyonensis]MBU8537440.1 hypothetical protein [Falsiroseomonas tokyonensis]